MCRDDRSAAGASSTGRGGLVRREARRAESGSSLRACRRGPRASGAS